MESDRLYRETYQELEKLRHHSRKVMDDLSSPDKGISEESNNSQSDEFSHRRRRKTIKSPNKMLAKGDKHPPKQRNYCGDCSTEKCLIF